MDLILYKSSDLKPLSPLEVLGEFAKNRFGKYFPVAVISQMIKLQSEVTLRLVKCNKIHNNLVKLSTHHPLSADKVSSF